ncbi:MAG: endonuclease/exonuclease/phosphatase family protein, partial [Myxococcales bacterium]
MGRLITVVTWNIHGCIGSDRRFDMSRVAGVLQAIDADVIGLQEVGEVHGRMPLVDQARALAELTGRHVAYGANVEAGSRRYGNAILSRFPILAQRNYDLSVPGKEPRGCLRADLDLGEGSQLHLFNVHLGLSGSERRKQQSLLLSADILHDAALAFPMIVLGDFNHLFPGPLKRLVRSALQDCAVATGMALPTFHARVPVFRLD